MTDTNTNDDEFRADALQILVDAKANRDILTLRLDIFALIKKYAIVYDRYLSPQSAFAPCQYWSSSTKTLTDRQLKQLQRIHDTAVGRLGFCIAKPQKLSQSTMQFTKQLSEQTPTATNTTLWRSNTNSSSRAPYRAVGYTYTNTDNSGNNTNALPTATTNSYVPRTRCENEFVLEMLDSMIDTLSKNKSISSHLNVLFTDFQELLMQCEDVPPTLAVDLYNVLHDKHRWNVGGSGFFAQPNTKELCDDLLTFRNQHF